MAIFHRCLQHHPGVNFVLPFFSYWPISCCRVFRLPNFPLPFFLLPLFLTLIFCCPFSYTVISCCQIFRCHFYCCRFYILLYHILCTPDPLKKTVSRFSLQPVPMHKHKMLLLHLGLLHSEWAVLIGTPSDS